jgi:hypothetical protein
MGLAAMRSIVFCAASVDGDSAPLAPEVYFAFPFIEDFVDQQTPAEHKHRAMSKCGPYLFSLVNMERAMKRLLSWFDDSSAVNPAQNQLVIDLIAKWERQVSRTPYDGLPLLSQSFRNPVLRKFAVQTLKKNEQWQDESMRQMLLQLVRALNYEEQINASPLAELLVKRSQCHEATAYALNWFLTAEMQTDPRDLKFQNVIVRLSQAPTKPQQASTALSLRLRPVSVELCTFCTGPTNHCATGNNSQLIGAKMRLSLGVETGNMCSKDDSQIITGKHHPHELPNALVPDIFATFVPFYAIIVTLAQLVQSFTMVGLIILVGCRIIKMLLDSVVNLYYRERNDQIILRKSITHCWRGL